PYGLVPVAGLTLDQARTAIERHLAAHLRNPRVTLSLAQAGGPMLNPPLTASSEGKFTAFVGEQQQQLAMIGGNPGGWQPASAPLQAPAAEPIPAGSPPAAGWHSAPRLGENVSVQAASSWRPVQGDQHLVPASYQS